MMFSSNQVFEISGSMDQLQAALQFALDYSGHAKDMTQREIARGCKLVYQIAKDGKYCIGWSFNGAADGWNEYPFDFDVNIVAPIIAQHLGKLETPDNGYEWADGGESDGFLMKTIMPLFSDESDGIKKPFYGIVCFEKFKCFYAK